MQDLKGRYKWGLEERGLEENYQVLHAGEGQEHLPSLPVEIRLSAPIQDTATIPVEHVEPGHLPGIGYLLKYRCHERNFPRTVP